VRARLGRFTSPAGWGPLIGLRGISERASSLTPWSLPIAEGPTPLAKAGGAGPR